MPTDAQGFLDLWRVGVGSAKGDALAMLVPILTTVGGLRLLVLILRRSVEGRG